jgi:hypothetical protein
MPSESRILSRLAAWFRANWRHPAMALPALVMLTQMLEEFYPFSHFPMYSNPTAEPSALVFVIDADKRSEDGGYIPVSMERVFGVRAAKTKKILYTRLFDRADELGVKKQELTPRQVTEVASTVLSYLRDRAEDIGKADRLPPRLALVHVEIHAEVGVALHQNESIIAEETAAP